MAPPVAHPLDVVKSTSIDQAGARVYKGPSCFSHIYRNEGLQGLCWAISWDASPGYLRYATYGIRAYVMRKSTCAARSQPTPVQEAFCGAVAGGTASIIGVPSEVSLVRMSGDRKLPATDPNRRNYTSVFNAMRRIGSDKESQSMKGNTLPAQYC